MSDILLDMPSTLLDMPDDILGVISTFLGFTDVQNFLKASKIWWNSHELRTGMVARMFSDPNMRYRYTRILALYNNENTRKTMLEFMSNLSLCDKRRIIKMLRPACRRHNSDIACSRFPDLTHCVYALATRINAINENATIGVADDDCINARRIICAADIKFTLPCFARRPALPLAEGPDYRSCINDSRALFTAVFAEYAKHRTRHDCIKELSGLEYFMLRNSKKSFDLVGFEKLIAYIHAYKHKLL